MKGFPKRAVFSFASCLVLMTCPVAAEEKAVKEKAAETVAEAPKKEGAGGKYLKTRVEVSDLDHKLIAIAMPSFRKLGRKWTADGYDVSVEEFEKAYLVLFMRPEEPFQTWIDEKTGIEMISGFMPRAHGSYMVWIDRKTMKVAQANWNVW